jgi:oligopeptide/dipeptide ABC transporter ATP-binding protein
LCRKRSMRRIGPDHGLLRPDALPQGPLPARVFPVGSGSASAIARALALTPSLWVCDEPVSALDVSYSGADHQPAQGFAAGVRLTYLFHLARPERWWSTSAIPSGSCTLATLWSSEPSWRVFERPLHPYTWRCSAPSPRPTADVRMNRVILEGSIPSPANPPRDANFHTRCNRCMNAAKPKRPAARGGARALCDLPPLQPVRPVLRENRNHYTAPPEDDGRALAPRT